MKPLAILGMGLSVLFSVAEIAYGHSPIRGMNSFYNGLLHPAFVPAHILSIIAFGLLLGQQELPQMRMALVGLGLAVPLGLMGTYLEAAGDLQPVILLISAVTGLLVIVNRKLPRLLVVTAGLFFGIVIGLDSPQAGSLHAQGLGLIGCAIGIQVMVLYTMGLSHYFGTRRGYGIAIRVVGSWIAASSFLVLALSAN